MITLRETTDSFIVDFNTLDYWEGFDKILKLLEKVFEIKVVKKLDGPESRVWEIELYRLPFSLHNNPYGNYLKAKSKDSIEYIKNHSGHIQLLFL